MTVPNTSNQVGLASPGLEPCRLLIIFDLDGTLLDGHGAGHRAMEYAFWRVLGVSGQFDRVDFAGRTDPAMFRLAAERAGVVIREAEWAALFDSFVAELKRTADPTRALPGVRSLLAQLAAHPGLGVAIGTGNVKAGADIKLAAAGLAGLIPVGGYGSDGESRETMLSIAIERARAYYRAPDAPLLTVGDTPRDVAAAHHHGVPCVAVATGHYDAAVLGQAGADAVLPSLEDAERFYRTVERVSGVALGL